MYRYLKPMAVALLGSSLLTGCFTASLWDKKQDPRNSRKDILSDKVVALGKPKTPLAQYPHAIAMVGTTNDYLVTTTETDTAILQKIFDELDSSSLLLLSDAMAKRNPAAVHELHLMGSYIQFKVDPSIHKTKQAAQTLQTSGVDGQITLAFNKKAKDVTQAETATLNKLGFRCYNDKMKTGLLEYVDSKDPTIYTFCTRPTNIHLTVIQKTTDNTQLPHQLKRPINIQVSYTTSDKLDTRGSLGYLGTGLATPVIVALDVVTFPVQAVVFGLMFRGHKVPDAPSQDIQNSQTKTANTP